MYKILLDRAFSEGEDSPFKKIEPHKKFNTQLGTIFNTDLVECMREEMLEMYHKNITDICMPWRDDKNRFMGPPINELEFENISLTHI